ncbi:MAG: PAS domain S-box protein [Chloroflexi bacterium]|nr:PAS domain S-box protein [Chloroflexota bacterium]
MVRADVRARARPIPWREAMATSDFAHLDAVESATGVQAGLDDVVGQIVQAVGGEAGFLTLWATPGGGGSQLSTYGLSPDSLRAIAPLIHQIAELLHHQPAPTPVGADDLQPAVPAELDGLQAVAFPLQYEGRLHGFLCLLHPPEATDLLRAHPGIGKIIVDQVTVVVQNSHLLQRLTDEKRWLEAVVAHSADGILIVDTRRRIVGFNPAFERLSGWRVTEARGRRLGEAFGLRTREGQPFDPLSAPAGTGDAARRVDLLLRTRGGRTLDVEVAYAVIAGAEGQPLGSILNVRDITARREADELQSTFLSVISHELQTPIAVIRGYAELLGEEGLDLPPTELRGRLLAIRDESRRLAKMVENLLQASRLQAGGVALQRETLALSGLTRLVAERMASTTVRHRIAVDVPDDLPTVLADFERVREVLTNLLENAIKYSPDGGTIRIEGRHTGSEVVISVTDPGIGIPDHARGQLFRRFSRLNHGLVRRRKGTGLGLYICKAIVEAHGGRIWVESAPGGGTTFSFSIPREAPADLPVLFGRPGQIEVST